MTVVIGIFIMMFVFVCFPILPLSDQNLSFLLKTSPPLLIDGNYGYFCFLTASSTRPKCFSSI